ncbi:class I SAM-dependent methyltransferase [Phyllobacterium leguminum]|uniref:Methyltransferase family protein n=1 Tax=Phyllobacterium leguminum TaxID=314237 RepID=A0A318T4V9_9HYPH|nr:methyltransferase domain-containing protein [Phyllobacterium leguminum]PYE89255.1 methyltransferase family protein [Phyllobacterium leguminum]
MAGKAPEPATARRFASNADGYARFRPDYPNSILWPLAEAIAAVAVTGPLPVIDVGSGTGIFSRGLASLLPADIPIRGIEPSDAMRKQAGIEKDVTRAIAYEPGTAEALPVENFAARAVVAATAAHWFDRPAFYQEAARVIVPSGVLGIVEYIRDADRSPAARVIETFLAQQSEPKAYARPDYEKELLCLPDFTAPRCFEEDVILSLSKDEFVGLALSSSHARAVVERRGQAVAEKALLNLSEPLVLADGTIPYGYRFRLFIAWRK